MTKVTITCPITWYQQCNWIVKNCENYKDDTNWSMWQIGQDDIYFYLEDKDATLFTLLWK